MCGSVPEMGSWQAVMQQVFIDGRSPGEQQSPSGGALMISRHQPFAPPEHGRLRSRWFPGAASGNPRPVDVSDLVALPFQWGSAIRGKRLLHPLGVLAEGFVERTAPVDQGLPIPSSDVVVGVSKASGTPGALPDFIGLAFRVPAQPAGAPWDILLVSAGSGLLARAVALRPAISWSGQTLTTLMPLHYQGNNWWLRARIISEIDGLGLSLSSIRKRLEDDKIEVSLDQACGRGDFTPLARLTLTRAIDPGQDVSFDSVVNTAPGLSLHPRWLADLRATRLSAEPSRSGRGIGGRGAVTRHGRVVMRPAVNSSV